MRPLPGKSSRLPRGNQPVTRDAAPADQRRRILQAAADLIAEHGYRATTAEMIIRRAKVGYGTFYKHYEGKEACLLDLFDRSIERSERHLRGVYEAQEGGWPEKIAAVVAALFEKVGAEPAIARVCLVEAPTAGTPAIERYDEAVRRFEPFFEPGRHVSSHSERLPRTLEGTVVSGVLWIVHQQLRRREPEKLTSLLPETIEFVLRPYIGEEQAVRTADELVGILAAAPA
jgi:AcrR family transcriptional regulator